MDWSAGGAGTRCLPVSRRVLLDSVSGFGDITFLQGLREAGFVEGQNVVIERRRAGGACERLPALVAELVALRVDLMATFGTPAVRVAKVRVRRGEEVVGTGTVSSLKRFKDDVREVLAGLECGIGVDGVSSIQPGDILEAFTSEEVARTL